MQKVRNVVPCWYFSSDSRLCVKRGFLSVVSKLKPTWINIENLRALISHIFVLVCMREFGYSVSFGACQNEGDHHETTFRNTTYISVHHTISIISMASEMSGGRLWSFKSVRTRGRKKHGKSAKGKPFVWRQAREKRSHCSQEPMAPVEACSRRAEKTRGGLGWEMKKLSLFRAALIS